VFERRDDIYSIYEVVLFFVLQSTVCFPIAISVIKEVFPKLKLRFCRTFTENKPDLILYFTKLIKMDRVGFEPTCSASFLKDLILFAFWRSSKELMLVQIPTPCTLLINFLFLHLHLCYPYPCSNRVAASCNPQQSS